MKKIKKFYFVTASSYCIRKGRNGMANTVSSENSHSNVFDDYDSALAYARIVMMANNHCKDPDEFSEVVSVVEKDSEVKEDSVGYVHHAMKNGIERFDGYDTTGRYPVLFDEIIITEKAVHGSYNDDGECVVPEAVQKIQFIEQGKPDEFTEQQHESNQEAVYRMAEELGGIEGLAVKSSDDDDSFDEFDRMVNMIKRNSK